MSVTGQPADTKHITFYNILCKMFFITFMQRRPNVFEAGPALHERHTNVLCLLVKVSLFQWME